MSTILNFEMLQSPKDSLENSLVNSAVKVMGVGGLLFSVIVESLRAWILSVISTYSVEPTGYRWILSVVIPIILSTLMAMLFLQSTSDSFSRSFLILCSSRCVSIPFISSNSLDEIRCVKVETASPVWRLF